MRFEYKFGFFAGIIALVWFTIRYLAKWYDSEWADFISILIIAVAVYLTIVQKRNMEGGSVTFLQAFVSGIVCGFIICLMMGAFMYVYVGYVFPDYTQYMMHLYLNKYKADHISDEGIKTLMPQVQAAYSASGVFFSTTGLFSLFTGIISLIVAFVMKRNPKTA